MAELDIEITKVEIVDGAVGRGFYITALVHNPEGLKPEGQKAYNNLSVGRAKLTPRK